LSHAAAVSPSTADQQFRQFIITPGAGKSLSALPQCTKPFTSLVMTSTNDIRRSFLDYFEGAGHARVPSAPLVPHNDPTLMFVNAGMVPFKNVFTGLESRPYSTATSSQKCVRAGGKHNDLDNVGYTARHHTFFEMLGNFSFGDYFKEQATTHAWTLLTKEWELPADKLTVTVYHTDDQAFDLWKRISGLPDSRIIRIATKDNFWVMGSDGPCGPCSEIFYDHGDHIPGGPPGSPDEDGDRFVEIWNLVFMQFVQEADEIVGDLPRPSIDTGMGLERLAAVMQGVHDNYDTDTFKALIAASEEFTKTKAEGERQPSHRVIADHLRSSGFLIADGILPSNEGRGYVLRRIMRRAMRHAHILGAKEPSMHRLVPALVSEMGAAYPELVRAQPLIEATLAQEEARFRQTLANGLRLLDEATSSMVQEGMLPGETAFKLYDTFGFPYDLTEDALRARGLTVDRAGFDAAMAEQKAAARAAWKGSGEKGSDELWFDLAEELGSTEFIGYSGHEGEGVVLALVRDGQTVDRAGEGEKIQIILNQTPFYGESGGQIGDAGLLSSTSGFEGIVEDTSKPLGKLHALLTNIAAGEVKVGDTLSQSVDVDRRSRIRANHSATHLLHAALRHRLGSHVTQKGSLVAHDRLRFDFSHPSALGVEDIAAIEAEVNAQIRGNQPVTTRLMTPDDAIAAGAMALFGEKYGDEVRVLSMGRSNAADYSVELCGGTHVNALGDIQLFKIVSESAVSSGVRRIEALTGEAARQWLVERDTRLRQVATLLKSSPDEVPARVASLVEGRRRLEREVAEARRALAMGGGSTQSEAAGPEQVAGRAFLGQVVEGLDPKALRSTIDSMKQRVGSGIAALVAVNEGRASVAVGVTDDLAGQVSAVDLVKAAVAALGGQGGGGRPDMAQGGGPDGAKAQDALGAVREALEKVAA
jgi:alanyl-tRNA synthetase